MTLSCSPRLEKLSLFSPPPPCAKRMARGFRCLRAAIRAARPEPRQHFWKIVGSKNFLVWCSVLRETFWKLLKLLLGKPPESGSARLGHIPSLPGNRNCPWNRISHYNLPIWKAIAILCDFPLDFCFRLLCSFYLIRKRGLLAHTSPTF